MLQQPRGVWEAHCVPCPVRRGVCSTAPAPPPIRNLTRFPTALLGRYDIIGWPAIVVLVCGRLLTEAVRSIIWISCKWLLVGRLRTSRSVSRTTMFRWRVGRLIGVELQSTFALLRGTVLLNHLLTTLGAAVDRDAVVYTTDVHDWDLVQLDARATLLDSG